MNTRGLARLLGIATLSWIVGIGTLSSDLFGQCPSYVHKDDAPAGIQKNLPKGWFVFNKVSGGGLWKSPLDTFEPVLIPNTSGMNLQYVTLTLDGKWIICSGNGGRFVIKPDGTGKTTIPVQQPWSNVLRYYPDCPYGTTEIYYLATNSVINALPVAFGDDEVTFGGEHTIADFGSEISIYNGEMGVAGDKILAGLNYGNHNESLRTSYITIPNGGRGTATPADIYEWENDNWQTLYGCGLWMFPDGTRAIQNAGWLGSACSPSKWEAYPNLTESLMMDHKGFYITEWHYPGDPAIPYTSNDTAVGSGVSSNWVPQQWRFGNYAASSFGLWYMGNDTRFLIGTQEGTSQNPPVQYAIWLCEWSTNTWTLLTTPNVKTTKYQGVAVHFDSGNVAVKTPVAGLVSRVSQISARKSADGMVFRVSGIGDNSATGGIYSSDGRLVRPVACKNASTECNWNYTTLSGKKVVSGIYIVKMTSAGKKLQPVRFLVSGR